MNLRLGSMGTATEQSVTSVPDLSVVLVCWNNKVYLDSCLNSLYQAGLKTSFDVVVVDNGSSDGSQGMLSEKYPQVKLIQNDQNVGLGRASNQGIIGTKGRYVLLLNNDTLVNGPSLDTMVYYLEAHPDIGAVGGRLLNPDGSLQAGYNHFSTLLEEFLIATRIGESLWPGYPAHYDDCEPRKVSWLSSACLLLRREALDKIGLLDEEYFIYGDEADLQYRLSKSGWEVWFLPSAYTIHFGGRSMNRWSRRKMVYRGKILFYKKHYGVLRTFALRLVLGSISLMKAFLWGVTAILPRKRDQAVKEIKSNLAVIKLSVSPSLTP